jgi:outer membrane protein TolC
VELARGLQQWNILRSQARAAVYTWTIAGQQIEALREQEKLLVLALDMARIRYEQRQGKLSDIYRAEGEIAEVRNRISAQVAVKQEEESRLRALMNLPQAASLTPRSEEPDFKPLRFAEDTARLSGIRSDVQEIDARIKQMQLARTWQQLQSKPDLRIRFDHMQPLGKTTPVQFTAMAMVSIPIAPWSSKMYKAEVTGMERDISAMQSGRDALLLEARNELSRMAIRLESMNGQLNRFRTELIPALEKNLEAVRTGYQESREPLAMVIEALSELSEARQEYLNMKASYYLMITEYERLAEI